MSKKFKKPQVDKKELEIMEDKFLSDYAFALVAVARRLYEKEQEAKNSINISKKS